jgi:hypothetical protein
MARYGYVVFATPKEGREADWDEWHRENHVEHVLKIPGFRSCRRFRAPSPRPENQPAFMSVYEIDTDNVQQALGDLAERFGTPRMPATDASDRSKTVSWVWEATSVHHADETKDDS